MAAREESRSLSALSLIHILQYHYPLKPMTPASLFPVLANDCEHGDRNRSVKEYFTLWEGFGKGLKSIPASHREALPLWLDHFETLWACYTACIPSTAAPDVSFYDQSKTAAALAVALWRYHHCLLYTSKLSQSVPEMLARKKFSKTTGSQERPVWSGSRLATPFPTERRSTARSTGLKSNLPDKLVALAIANRFCHF